MSTIPPMRNPSRIPFLTHGFTRQPVFDGRVRLGRAHRARVQRIFETARIARNVLRYKRQASGRTELRSQSACELRAAASRPVDLSTASIFARLASDGGTIGQAGQHRLQQAHHGHRGLHRPGIHLAEIHFHQREPLPLEGACAGEIARQRELRQLAEFRRNFVRHHRDHSAAAQRDQRDGDGVVAAQHR